MRGKTTTMTTIGQEDIASVRIQLGLLKEQQKIATFLSSVDTKIEQLNKKKSLLKQHKKGLMQKLFSQEIRFKDEQGEEYPDWESKKLGKISTSFSGGTPMASNKDYYSGEIPFIKSGEISSSTVNCFISLQGFRNSSAKKIKKGDILYALYGATSGEVAISKIDGAINQAVLCIRSKYEHRYIFEYLKFKKLKIVATYIQGGQGNLSAGIINSVTIGLPCIEEQQKIANFLFAFDKKIEFVTEQIKQAQIFKKGLLQQMFI